MKLEVLHEACRIIGQALELDEALRAILRILAERLQMARTTITLYDEDLERFLIRASYGLTPEEARGFMPREKGLPARSSSPPSRV